MPETGDNVAVEFGRLPVNRQIYSKNTPQAKYQTAKQDGFLLVKLPQLKSFKAKVTAKTGF